MVSVPRRDFLQNVIAGSGLMLGGVEPLAASNPSYLGIRHATGPAYPKTGGTEAAPDPLFEKPAPIAMAELAQRNDTGVSAMEVNDYSAPGYKGDFSSSPPHADMNPRKAVIVVWKDHPQRFVFSHEASYVPWMQLPSGAGPCFQFYEGDHGDELFNQNGRKERNSSVDIVESGPDRVWVRWNYLCVNQADDSHPALRGTEDFVSYQNGLVWRRQTYVSLKPDDPAGHSIQPLDFFAVIPAGVHYSELLPPDEEHGDFLVVATVDAYSNKQYNVYWDKSDKPDVSGSFYARRTGASWWKDIQSSRGKAVVQTFKDGLVYCSIGDASGYPHQMTHLSDSSHPDTGSWNWGNVKMNHWPVGWVNSEGTVVRDKDLDKYPYHICPMSLFLVKEPFVGPINWDVWVHSPNTTDIHHLKWVEGHVLYSLVGVGHDFETVRRVSRGWLDKGNFCADPASIADLQ
jgi:hypothetical protein